MWCYFFFQAEDGIRDYKVTGVQTCALPIFPRANSPRVHIFWQRRIRAGDTGEKATPYWFPSQTTSGAIREDRIVLPKIGRASCRERGEVSGVNKALKKNSRK